MCKNVVNNRKYLTRDAYEQVYQVNVFNVKTNDLLLLLYC